MKSSVVGILGPAAVLVASVVSPLGTAALAGELSGVTLPDTLKSGDRTLDALTRRITHVQEALTRLADQQQTWTRTQDAAQKAQAPEPVLGQIAGVLAAIEAARAPLQAQRAGALELQSQVAREVARCQAVLAQVAEAQSQAAAVGQVPERPA